MELQKIYVSAMIRFEATGAMTPTHIKLGDRWFKIDQIYEVRKMPFRTGGAGVRYTIRVGKQMGYIMYDLFLEPLQWFIEADEQSLKSMGIYATMPEDN